MSAIARRPFPPPRPYGVRTAVSRPYYGAPGTVGGAGALGAGAGAGALGGALGALGGTLGCLLCLAAIGALGLFACVVAITSYTKRFLNAYKTANGISGAPGQLEIGFALLCASLFYVIINRIQRH